VVLGIRLGIGAICLKGKKKEKANLKNI